MARKPSAILTPDEKKAQTKELIAQLKAAKATAKNVERKIKTIGKDTETKIKQIEKEATVEIKTLCKELKAAQKAEAALQAQLDKLTA